ncbi:HAD family hydrolase [Wenjunlia tyrosinilytica]|uniref:Hydrolase n=1 Tax=Wenjunlia tyrosinilytica TaxID=1544741 RepID=A0A918DYJ7_9ACTN|nr:HAD-IA family hydrolase [Wenjunlia tyrosinilytica]GGO91070.1 hydrolase [Wenjunlia tyrosinilytica]
MTVNGVMFDFSGTLLRVTSTRTWLATALEAAGIAVDDEELGVWAARLETAGALPGGANPVRVPAHLERLWRERDLDGERHRAAYTGLTREAGLPWPDLLEPLYDLHMAPRMWRPYPDTAAVLGELRRRGVPVAVVSNIGWDLRPVFRHHGLDGLVDVYTLSFEHAVQKPDPALFAIACEGLGLPPSEVAMVGDSRIADAGAAALGCPVHFVDPLPVESRPDSLFSVVGLLGAYGEHDGSDLSGENGMARQ